MELFTILAISSVLFATILSVIFHLADMKKFSNKSKNIIVQDDIDSLLTKYINNDLSNSKRYKLVCKKIKDLKEFNISFLLFKDLLINTLLSLSEIERLKKVLKKINYDKLSKNNKKEYKLKESLLLEEKERFDSYIHNLDSIILKGVDSNKESSNVNYQDYMVDLKQFGLNSNQNNSFNFKINN